MAPRVPAAGFYAERLAKAQALPEAERSADQKLWLRLHAALDAAAASLPEVPSSCKPSRPLLGPLGGEKALAGLLRFTVASFAESHNPMHPKGTLRYLAPQLPPFMRVWVAGPNQVQMGGDEVLAEIMDQGLDADDADLEVLAQLLNLAVVEAYPEYRQFGVGLDVLAAIQKPLFGSSASLNSQLARLQERCSCGGGSSSSQDAGVPSEPLTAVQLQAAWAALAIDLAEQAASQGQAPPARVSAVTEQAARVLLRLQPINPRSSLMTGIAAMINASTNSTSALKDPLPHFQTGAELARQQGSDFWLARCCWMAAMVAALDSSPAVSPEAAAGLLQEADAAYARCKSLIPPWWQTTLKACRDMVSTMRPNIQAQAARSPHRWQAALQQGQLKEQQRRLERVMSRVGEGLPTCDGCGMPSAALKRCSSCRKAQYCSRECQKMAWPAHKAACKAAAQSQGQT